MARTTLDRSAKYKVLIRRLDLPRPYARGLLETLWDVAHECGNPVIGDAVAVEAAAEWPGEPGVFFDALRDGRWIDELPDGRWEIHDYFDHAPDYVSGRSQRELERKRSKPCEHCGKEYHSPDRRSKFCSDACRTAHWRAGVTECDGVLRTAPSQPVTVTERDGLLRSVTERDGTPAPAPAPAPLLKKKKRKSAPAAPSLARPPAEPPPRGFDDFWRAYPNRKAKAKAEQAWAKLAPDAALADAILAALDRHKRTDQWARDGGKFIPHPGTWLNGRRWEDQVDDAAEGDDNFAGHPDLVPTRHPTGDELLRICPELYDPAAPGLEAAC